MHARQRDSSAQCTAEPSRTQDRPHAGTSRARSPSRSFCFRAFSFFFCGAGGHKTTKQQDVRNTPICGVLQHVVRKFGCCGVRAHGEDVRVLVLAPQQADPVAQTCNQIIHKTVLNFFFYSGLKTRSAPSTFRCWDANHIPYHEFGRRFQIRGALFSFAVSWPKAFSRLSATVRLVLPWTWPASDSGGDGCCAVPVAALDCGVDGDGCCAVPAPHFPRTTSSVYHHFQYFTVFVWNNSLDN